MQLNKLGSYARNLLQSSRITSLFARSRNDSSSFFQKSETQDSQGVHFKHVRRVSELSINFQLEFKTLL